MAGVVPADFFERETERPRKRGKNTGSTIHSIFVPLKCGSKNAINRRAAIHFSSSSQQTHTRVRQRSATSFQVFESDTRRFRLLLTQVQAALCAPLPFIFIQEQDNSRQANSLGYTLPRQSTHRPKDSCAAADLRRTSALNPWCAKTYIAAKSPQQPSSFILQAHPNPRTTPSLFISPDLNSHLRT